MIIIVKTLSGKDINLDVEPTTMIINIKIKISESERYPLEQQRLFYRGRELKDNKTLENYNIINESIFNLFIQNTFTINVKTPTGNAFELYVNSNTTIIDLKIQIKYKKGYPTNEQTLLFLDKELQDDRTLKEYSIMDESILKLIVKEEFHTINIKTTIGNIITLKVDPKTTIKDLKTKLSENKDYCSDQQTLFYKDYELKKDYLTLENLYIISESNLYIANVDKDNKDNKYDENFYDINVKTLTGENIILSVNSKYKVKDIKNKIKDLEGFHPDQQQFIFEGKQLQDDSILCNVNVVKESVLHLILRLRQVNKFNTNENI